MQVYYFSRTGRSKEIATKIANSLNQNSNEIKDTENWQGLKGFIKGGAKASIKDTVDISYAKPDRNDEFILVFPIWAGTFPPAVRSFLNEINCNEKVTLIPTSLMTKLKKRDEFKKVIDLVGKDIMSKSVDEILK